jgi:LuxR family transcriptional regulator, maltose regulon positive regulatory protein
MTDLPPATDRPPAPAGPSAGLPLLATKLFVPRPRPDLVRRPRLLDRLHDGLRTATCTVLSAPAGAGKTSLLAAWAAELDRPVAWLALDERDQDVALFLRYLLAALRVVVPTRRTYPADGPPVPEAVLTSLINDVAAAGRPGLLVLDDYHVVHAPPVHDAVRFLLDHLPPDLHLVVASREDPPLPLPRLRARGRLVELRAADLGFTVEEAGALLDAAPLHLTETQAATLVERTEGWAAGLQLAGLALRDRPDAAAFVSAFAGDHRLVTDYLSSEVLARQPPRTRRFLRATAFLDRMCAPLCDAVLGNGVDGDSQRVLEELERANLFVVPLDGQRVWYRYHHLFADTLRALLAHDEEAGEGAARHRRASAWFGDRGLLPEAIQHAIAGGAHDDAAGWLEALTPVMLASVDVHHTMETWLAELPDALVRSRPILCLARAWILIHHLEIADATAWATAAERALPSDDGPTARHARGAVAAVQALLATLGPAASPEEACTLADRAFADLPAQDAPFRGVAAVACGQAELARGRGERAEKVLTAAVGEGRAAGLVHGALLVAGHQVAVQRLRGARLRALAAGRGALSWAAGRGGPAALGHGVLAVLVADLLADGNEPADALPLMLEGHRILTRFGERPPLVLMASLGLARLRLADGDAPAAAEVLAPVRDLLARGPYGPLAVMLAAGEAQVRLALGDADAAVAWASAQRGELPLVFRMQTHVFASAVDTLLLAPARILVDHGVATGDVTLLRRAAELLTRADELGLGWLGLRAAVLRAAVESGLGDRAAARTTLAAAVVAAEPEYVVRPFAVCPGVPDLLHEVGQALTGAPRSFVDVLLAASRPMPGTLRHPDGLVEPLTARELDVLRLLAAGRSNAGMAHVLTVEQSTVKTHLVHLYEKLGVHSRTAAVARARSLRLLG